MKNTTLYFVMDGPDFESGALLLASSMRQEFGTDPVIEACVPEARRDSVSPLTQALLERMQVSIRYFAVEAAEWTSPYPHGNKILASCLPRETASAIFFDTDTVVTGPMNIEGLDQAHTVMVAPECTATWGRQIEDWGPVYALFDLEVPEERVRLFRGRRSLVPPYFNAGLVGYTTARNKDGLTFPDLWRDTARRIDQTEGIPNKRPWLDQIALPIAAARLGARMDIRDEAHNYNLYRRNPDDQPEMHLAHYHQACVYRNWPQCLSVAHGLMDRCDSDEERRELDARIRPFLRSRRQKAAAAAS
jgi:hypothetical protein